MNEGRKIIISDFSGCSNQKRKILKLKKEWSVKHLKVIKYTRILKVSNAQKQLKN